jgi:hypothetical protein
MTAPTISRRQAWCKLAVLIADGAPTPRDINFFQPGEYSGPMLDVIVEDASALWWWAEHFGATVEDPTVMKHNGGWMQKAVGDWHGYYVTVKTYDASNLGERPGGMDAVHALANQTPRAGDPDLAPEVPAVATPRPGGNGITPGEGKVAGAHGDGAPATARPETDAGGAIAPANGTPSPGLPAAPPAFQRPPASDPSVGGEAVSPDWTLPKYLKHQPTADPALDQPDMTRVWVAAERKGIDFHSFAAGAADRRTDCGRATNRGARVPRAEAETFGRPCQRCYPRRWRAEP